MVTMATTLSTLLSPLMGGQLADLAGQYPERFGNNWFLKKYPYATPAFVNASMLFITFMAIFFFLEEVRLPLEPWMYVSVVLTIFQRPRPIHRRRVTPTLVWQSPKRFYPVSTVRRIKPPRIHH